MVQPENIDSRHSNSQLGDRCGCRHRNLAHLLVDALSPAQARSVLGIGTRGLSHRLVHLAAEAPTLAWRPSVVARSGLEISSSAQGRAQPRARVVVQKQVRFVTTA